MNSFRLALVTWNVGGAQPGIVPGTTSLLNSSRHADIVVVGLQEVAVGTRGWKTELIKALGPSWVYIGGESYAGMRLKAFCRLNNGRPIVAVTPGTMRVGVGFGDRWPNKGAVAVDMRFGTTCRVAFVVAHLAANEDQVRGRADDWRAILRRLDRDQFLGYSTEPSVVVPLFHQYDHVFVLGDLNYRIVPPQMDRDTRIRWVEHRVSKKDWASLAAVDQLNKERLSGKVFANFQEAPIDFPPTFKIDPKTGQYSGNRVPSYCDRILWHSLPSFTDLVQCMRYQPLQEFKQSDHLPLYGEFNLKVPIILSIPRPILSSKGIRVVLEFMLVRFSKKLSKTAQRDSLDEPPTSMRHIDGRDGFRMPSLEDGAWKDTASDEKTRYDHELGFFLFDENGEDSDEDFGDEAGDDGEASSCYSSSSDSEEDNHNPEGYSCEVASDRKILEKKSLDQDFVENNAFGSRETEQSAVHGYNVKLLSSYLHKVESDTSSTSPKLKITGTADGTKYCSGRANVTSSPVRNAQSRQRGVVHRRPLRKDIGPRKRDSLSEQVVPIEGKQKTKKRSRLNGMRMEVHGQGLFLKQGRIYEVGIPKRKNGKRERIGDSLPVIPLAPLSSLKDLEYRHVLVEFARMKSRVGTSGVLPLKPLLPYIGKPYAFELNLTKYGMPDGMLEACVQLTVSDCGHWLDSQGRVVRLFDGSPAKKYRGPLRVRQRTRARSKPDTGRWRGPL